MSPERPGTSAEHPSLDRLTAFGLGKLDDASSLLVTSHLESCPDCRRQVAEVSGDSLLGRFQKARWSGDNTTPSPSSAKAPTPGPTGASRSGAKTSFGLEVGESDDYEVIRELGHGGMGVVYLVHNKLMDRLEVFKILNRSLLDQPGALERFIQEIQTVANLRHDNIVAAHRAWEKNGQLVLAMEYVDGLNLAERVKSQGPMPVAEACRAAHQAALGLQHSFEKGTVHRDIKPHNLILTHASGAATVKILDFGLAKMTRHGDSGPTFGPTGITGVGTWLGTPDYIAPEQTSDAAKVDIRADIYSLGCTLYFLLTGRPPFQANDFVNLVQAHRSATAKRLDAVRPDVPAKLASVVAKAMAKKPEQRYQTPAEFAAAMTQFMDPAVDRPPRDRFAGSLILAGILAISVLVGASLWGSSFLRIPEEPSPAEPVAAEPASTETPAKPLVDPRPKPESPRGAKALTAGSVWKGKLSYRKGAWSGSTVSYFLHIAERKGNSFTGERYDNGPKRNWMRVKGEIFNETEIRWIDSNDAEPAQGVFQGSIDGDTIRFTFRRDFPNRSWTEGDGQATLVESADGKSTP